MPDDHVTIFESADSLMVKTVTHALDGARIAHEVRFDRLALPQYGPKKPPRRIVVAQRDEAIARAVADAAAARRSRVVDVDAESRRAQRFASPGRDGGGGTDGGVVFFGGVGDCDGGGGGCD